MVLYLNQNNNRFLRFLISGGVNTLFGFIVYSVVIVITGGQVWIALLVGMLVGVAFNFFTTGGYVFRQLSISRFPYFLVCYLIIFFVNLILIEILSNFVIDKILIQLILLLPMAIISYFILKKYVFNQAK